MTQRRNGFSLIGLFIVMVVVILVAGLLLPALARTREMSRRVKCGKNINQLIIAQLNYSTEYSQKYQTESWVRGTEVFCVGRPRGPAVLANANRLTDGSRAMIYLAKRNFVDVLSGYVCPSDPFAAPLDAPGRNLTDDDRDFPAEGVPVRATQWRSPNSPAASEAGHTWYSYSMQSGSQAEPRTNFSAKADGLAQLPIFAERNPWGNEVQKLAGGSSPVSDQIPTGNSWNHNREGQSVALRAGNISFEADAREWVLPKTGDPGAARAFFYLYADSDGFAEIPERAPRSVGYQSVNTGLEVPATNTKTANKGWNCYLVD